MPSRLIYPFPGSEIAPVAEVGGKGASLLIGRKEGLPVPPGFILSVHFFAPWLRQLKATSAWSDFLRSSGNDQMKACDTLKQASEELFLDDAQEQALSHALEAFGKDTLFAVRPPRLKKISNRPPSRGDTKPCSASRDRRCARR